MIAVIGGSGLTQLANLEITRRQIVRTPYGEAAGPLTFGRIGEREIVFLARHGYGHTLAPHEVNYRANLWAIHEQKVTHVIAIATVGGIAANLGAGSIAVGMDRAGLLGGKQQRRTRTIRLLGRQPVLSDS